jgi:hypothetical protein
MKITKNRWDMAMKRIAELEQKVAILELPPGPTITSQWTPGHNMPIQTTTYFLPDPAHKAPVWYMESGEIRNVD